MSNRALTQDEIDKLIDAHNKGDDIDKLLEELEAEIELINKKYEVPAATEEQRELKCTCGAEKIKSLQHSDWCDYEKTPF